MSTPENTFIGSVHKYLPEHVYREKQHNAYRGGAPDCYYEYTEQRWVEYKFIVLPKRDDTVIVPNLSALQIEWLTRNAYNGHQPRVIVGCRQGGVVLVNSRTWTQGVSCADFKAALMSRQELADHITRIVS